MKKAVVALAFVLPLVGCGGGEQAPDCHFTGAGDSGPSAGCLVLYRNELLLMEGRGQFGPPAGSVNAGESTQCAAERETWEETSVEVAARDLINVFDNGFHLYWCEPVGRPEPAVRRPLEVNSVGFFTRAELRELPWRYPEQVPAIEGWISERME